MTAYETDVLIVGAGPVGLFAIAQIGMQAGLKCHVIDSLDKPGGQPAELYPDKPIYDIPGYPVITGAELTANLMQQAKPFSPMFHLGERVQKLERIAGNRWIVTSDNETSIDTAVIIIASGRGLFNPRKPRIEEIDRCENKSVFYSIRSGVREKLRDKNVVIAGGGDSALDWALELHSEARNLTLIHRRDSFRAAEDSVRKMKALVENNQANFLVGEAVQLKHEGGSLASVCIKTAQGTLIDIETDYFLPFFGMTPKLGALAEWGLEIEKGKIVVDRLHCETSVQGIYAIGDANTYEGKQDLILTGFQEAAHATAGAYKTVTNKDLKVQFTTSSSAILNSLGVEKHVDVTNNVGFETTLDELIKRKLVVAVKENG